jgi:hypothetical protein
MQGRYTYHLLPAIAALLLLLTGASQAVPIAVIGEPMYTLRYVWPLHDGDMIYPDTVQSDTVWGFRYDLPGGPDSIVMQMRFFRFTLPTPPAACVAWGVEAWTIRLGVDSMTGVVMQIYPQDAGETSFSYYPNQFWGQFPTYHACPFGELSMHHSSPAVDSHNAWLLTEEHPATSSIIMGVRTYPASHIHLIDHVVLNWDTGSDAEPPPGLSTSFSVAPCYPNPFNSSATLPFTLAAPGPTSVVIYNLLGERLATLFDGNAAAGPQAARWSPVGVGSGVYLVAIRSSGQVATQRITYIR